MNTQIETIEDYIYVNFTIENKTDDEFIPAKFLETFTAPIISKADDYKMTVESFAISALNIPLLIFRIQEGPAQANINLGTYSVTLRHVPSGTDFQQFIMFTPQDPTVILPTSPAFNGGVQDFSSHYYFIYSYQYMLNLVNTAFNNAFLAYNIAFPGVISGPPYYYYDFDREQFTLVVPSDYITLNNVEVWVNKEFQILFPSHQYVRGLDPSNGKSLMYVLTAGTNNENAYWPPGIAQILPSPYFQFKSEYELSEYWNSIEKILILSNTLPITREFIQTNNNSGNVGTRVGLGVLSSFTPDVDRSGDSRRTFIYDNTSDYRWITLSGSQEIKNVGLEFFFLSSEQLFFPISIDPKQTIHIKLAFQKIK